MKKIWLTVQAVFMIFVLFAALGLVIGFFGGVIWWFAKFSFLLIN